MNLELSVRDEMLIAVPSLRAFALSLTSDRSQADDLVQGTLEVSCPPSKLTTTKSLLRIWAECPNDRTFRRSPPRQLATCGHRSGIQGTDAGLFNHQP
jgi:hypothetical protein